LSTTTPPGSHQAGHEIEVEEDALEAVVAVDEREVELPAFPDRSR